MDPFKHSTLADDGRMTDEVICPHLCSYGHNKWVVKERISSKRGGGNKALHSNSNRVVSGRGLQQSHYSSNLNKVG